MKSSYEFLKQSIALPNMKKSFTFNKKMVDIVLNKNLSHACNIN